MFYIVLQKKRFEMFLSIVIEQEQIGLAPVVFIEGFLQGIYVCK